MVDVWLLPLADGIAEEECRAIVSPEEWARAQRFRFPRDRALSLHARAAVRLLLAERLSVPPQSIVFEYEARGRPILPQRPLEFSISHAGELVAIAISSHGTGIDIEAADRKLEVEPLLRFLPPAEAAAIAGLRGPEQSVAFLRAWTRKEAALKASGAGLAGMRLEDPSAWRYFQISHDGYLGTVAAAPDCPVCGVEIHTKIAG